MSWVNSYISWCY